MRPIRVLVVDDSAFMRHAISRLLREAEGIEVVGSAGDGEQGMAAAVSLRPDVITLDVEMPVLDGLGMLRRLMRESPTRVVMLSSLTSEGAAVTLDALDAGAIDFVPKPSGSLSIDLGMVRDDLVGKVRAAAAIPQATFLAHRLAAQTRLAAPPPPLPVTVSLPGRPQAAAGAARPAAPGEPARRIVAIASSTGGPGALHTLARGLPAHLGAGVLIVQHMPAHFTASLAERLDGACLLPVHEARAGDVIAEDTVLVAPGGTHLLPTGRGRVELAALPPINGLRPAADVTLQALAPLWRERALVVVLTGMGSDGREGARAVAAHGGTVYAQDEATCVVYGMPAAVAEAGLVDRVVPLPAMADAIHAWARGAARESAATASTYAAR